MPRIIAAGILLAVFAFQVAAQDESAPKVKISGDLITIYTLGNADPETQKIDDPDAVGVYLNSLSTGTRKNGYYTAANLYATLNPYPWLEGYFKLYTIHRPGSIHLPLSMENQGKEDLVGGTGFNIIKLDSMYGKASVFQALELDLPVDLYLKAGRYKSQAAQYGIVSKYRTEQVLYMMNTKTDLTYELGVGLGDILPLTIFASTNYLMTESVPKYWDEDGASPHGDLVLNEYAPQFLVGVQLKDFNNISGELIYGQNVSNIFSGHAAGASGRYTVKASEEISIPIGLQFGFFEKNIDMLGQAAIAAPSAAAGNTFTMDFRNSMGVALGTGLRLSLDIVKVDFNVAGSFNMIKHYYREDLNVIKLSADTMATFLDKYFVGGGFIMGTVAEVEWKTKEEFLDKDQYDHIFKPAENMGFEVYGGLNLSRNSKFVIGFNQNKGISLNHMLEARPEGQMKYKQDVEGTSWSQDKLAEAGGLYFKFHFNF